MVMLYTCEPCSEDKHTQCKGNVYPSTIRDGGTIIGGGAICTCCGNASKVRREEKERGTWTYEESKEHMHCW